MVEVTKVFLQYISWQFSALEAYTHQSPPILSSHCEASSDTADTQLTNHLYSVKPVARIFLKAVQGTKCVLQEEGVALMHMPYMDTYSNLTNQELIARRT